MAQRITITQDEDGAGGWVFVGTAYDVAEDGTATVITEQTSSIGSTTGTSLWQTYINGASFVLDQMTDFLS